MAEGSPGCESPSVALHSPRGDLCHQPQRAILEIVPLESPPQGHALLNVDPLRLGVLFGSLPRDEPDSCRSEPPASAHGCAT